MAATPNGCLTTAMAPFLDRHLVLQLLKFLKERGVYGADIDTALLKMHEKMMMTQEVRALYKANGKPVPASLEAREAAILAQQASLRERAGPLLAVIEDSELYQRMQSGNHFNMEVLAAEHGVTADALDALYQYTRVKFDCADYEVAADVLPIVRQLTTDPVRAFAALWGAFAAQILFELGKPKAEANWDGVKETMHELRDAIDSTVFASHAEQLMQRAWLLHWSLFVFFSYEGGRVALIELFMSEAYLAALQTACPHLIRYLVVAVINSKRRRTTLRDLVRVIQHERESHSDCVTQFLEALYVAFDFDAAQAKLQECASVLANDFFLAGVQGEFMECARLFVFETYCRIHETIDMAMLASKLSMPREEAEHWIVDLIHHARLDAKINSQLGQVVMQEKHPSIYQQIIESSKGLAFRSHVLANYCNRLEERE